MQTMTNERIRQMTNLADLEAVLEADEAALARGTITRNEYVRRAHLVRKRINELTDPVD